MIYLDNCATTQPSKSVIREVTCAMERDFANPSSLHDFGHRVEKEIGQIRGLIKSYLRVKSGEVLFTSGGTESNNMALKNFIDTNLYRGNRVVTSNIEHPSILQYLRSRDDIDLVCLRVNNRGQLDLEDLLKSIDERTILLSIFHVNNELGSIHDVESICKRAKDKYPDIKIHLDGVQALGKIPVNLSKILCDSYSFSGHKFHGPKGIGGLYLRDKEHFRALIHGGGQEFGYRSGTYNTVGIYGMGQAFRDLTDLDQAHFDKIRQMKALMLDRICKEIEDIKVNSPEESSPFMLNISIGDTRGEVLLHILEQKDIYISTSSACSSHRTGKNPVLEAIGLDGAYIDGTIRICLSHMTKAEEIDVFCHSLREAVDDVRTIIRRK